MQLNSGRKTVKNIVFPVPNIRKILYFLFLFFVFFPYIEIIELGTDMQPYAVLVGALLLPFYKKKVTWSEALIIVIFSSSFLLLLIGELNILTVRSLFNYCSLLIVSFVTFRILRSKIINFDFFLKACIAIWFVVALIQSYISREFLTFIVSSTRTTENRGVTGLAPEPTFLGIVFVFFILYLLHIDTRHKKKFIILCVIGIVLLAESSMAVLFLAVLLFLYLLTHLSAKLIFAVFLLAVLTPVVISNFEGSRLLYLLKSLIDDPASLLFVDASINDRFFHIFFSMKGFLYNYMFPHGYSEWLPYAEYQMSEYSNFVIVEWFSLGGRIMSGYGAAFYELGFFAFLIPIALLNVLYGLYSNNIRLFIFHFLFINIIMFSAVPIGFSLFAFYLGFLNYLNWDRLHRKVTGKLLDDVAST
jgi:hypothetical protein